MRNKLNEVKEFDIISRCDTIRIAMFDEPYPYIVPVNFGEEIIGDQVVFYIHIDYEGKRIDTFNEPLSYEGKKNDLLAKNPNTTFEMDCNHELYYRESNMSCNFRYESVVGTGRVEIVPEEEKEKALTLLMNHYHPVSVKFNPKFVHMTQCMKIVVNDMTAKRAMPKKDTPDYKVMQFQGEVRSPHMYEEKNRS